MKVGHVVEGVWVFGGVEYFPDRPKKEKMGSYFALTVPNRTRETLHALIRRYIRPGTTIWSDCWGPYMTIEEMPEGYHHSAVNHSVEFVSANGTHTNLIEGLWHFALKSKTPTQYYNQYALPMHLLKLQWMRIHRETLWDSFWTCMADVRWTRQNGLYSKTHNPDLDNDL